ncbi:DUF2252 domain-containing protein [Leptolyngbya sp. NIES-2104]|uniref:DUF2252 domain-containing protein n=1 Tax=Leptolyngbya sp. NIES-2104 TaxID=1552121 RepID=UPI0006EC7394|nr:DUF2252 domain-containing protein [Leptolyngbya sp. NIES-2104]GAP98894.1 hypothetical protein NIES2104_54500 [Leptolyngbya sp. NIES-2104]
MKTLNKTVLDPNLSIDDRVSAGKALRQKVKRRDLGVYKPAQNRPDPIDLLKAQTQTRLPDLIPVYYERMLASPFAFLRGSAAVMIQDIANAPTTDISVQACGDMHVSNFGVFASAERNLVFAINDFDETCPGAWEWDLKRLVTSAIAAGRHLDGDRELCESAVRSIVQSYRQHLHEYAQMSYLDLWYAQIEETELLKKLPDEQHKKAARILEKARECTHLQTLDKLTELVNDQHQIIESPPLVVRTETLIQEQSIRGSLEELIQDYLSSIGSERRFLLSRYRIIDVARKVVGVGSVGTRCWIIYLEGRDQGDPLFLQVKEAQSSVLLPYAERFQKGRELGSHEGERVVIGQRLIQGAPDIFLGWGDTGGIHYYVRQLRDMKGSIKLEPGKFRPKSLLDYGVLCGWALALAHAKSGDAAMLAGYVGNSEALDDAMVTFAFAYADQTEQDYDRLIQAAKQGQIPVEI